MEWVILFEDLETADKAKPIIMKLNIKVMDEKPWKDGYAMRLECEFRTAVTIIQELRIFNFGSFITI